MSPSVSVSGPSLSEFSGDIFQPITNRESCQWAWREFLFRSNLHQVFDHLLFGNDADFIINYGTSESGNISVPCHDLNQNFQKWYDELNDFLTHWYELKTFEQKRDFIFDSNNRCFRHDLPGLCHGILDRWEEDLNSTRDSHGRFPFEQSVLYKQEVLTRPVVDEIANTSGQIICHLAELKFRKPDSHFCLSWDVDSAGFWYKRPALSNTRRVIRDRGMKIFPDLISSGLKAMKNPAADPHLPYRNIIKQLRPHKARCTFFVQTNKWHPVDNYDLLHADELRKHLLNVQESGHEIALHSSYATHAPEKGTESLQIQRNLLEGLLLEENRTCKGLRAHYLRLAKRRSDIIMTMDYDASVCFSGHEGFRLGTAWPVRYDNGDGHKWYVIPPHAMDVSLRYHRSNNPYYAKVVISKLYTRVKETGGIFSLIWHPNNLDSFLWEEWRKVPFYFAQKHSSDTCSALLQKAIASTHKSTSDVE